MLFAVSWNLEDPFSREKYKKFTMVTKIHPHPKYRTNAFELWYDAAILEIHQALTPSMGAIPICLPPPNFTVFKNHQKKKRKKLHEIAFIVLWRENSNISTRSVCKVLK